MEEYIGKPSYGNENKNKRVNAANSNWRIDTEGSHLYRVLPPFGLLAPRGIWAKYEAIHWGFTGSNGKQRPFRCIQKRNYKTKMIEVECPMCKEIAVQTGLKEAKENELKAKGIVKTEWSEYTKPLTDWLRKFNLQRGFFLNVLRPDNQIGRLFIKISHKTDLDREIKNIIADEGVDPIEASEGVLLNFERTGSGFNSTKYTVSRVYENVTGPDGRRLKALKTMPLTEDILTRMKTEAFELANGFKELSHDEISMLVGSHGDPSIVDSIFGAPRVGAMAETPLMEEAPSEPDEAEYATPKVNSQEAALAAFAQSRSARPAPAASNVDSDIDAFLSKYTSK